METLNQTWSPAPENLLLADHEVHVWRAGLDIPSFQVQALRTLLADDEQDRARHFVFEMDRQRFIAARGTLRSILSRYVTIHPGRLRFEYNPHGKPFLASEFGSHPLNFNLSHSGSIAIYAITRNGRIGIDVEQVRPDFTYEEIAERFFSANELTMLHRLPAELKRAAFYRYWTRKEAYSKARGKGLSLPLDSFDVSFPPRDLVTGEEAQQCSDWTILDLQPAPGFQGALAVRGMGYRFKYWDWDLL